MLRKVITTASCFVLLVASARISITAQDLPYRLSDKEVERLVGQIKKDTDRFRKSANSAIHKVHLDRGDRDGDIKDFIKDFDKETDRLHDRFKDHKSVSADVQSVLDRAAAIDRFMARYDLREKAQRDWSAVRSDLDQLAQAYNVTWNWQR